MDCYQVPTFVTVKTFSEILLYDRFYAEKSIYKICAWTRRCNLVGHGRCWQTVHLKYIRGGRAARATLASTPVRRPRGRRLRTAPPRDVRARGMSPFFLHFWKLLPNSSCLNRKHFIYLFNSFIKPYTYFCIWQYICIYHHAGIFVMYPI